MLPDPLQLFLFLNQLQISSVKKKMLLKKKRGNYALPLLLKFLATPLSAVYQHFSDKGSKFRYKTAAKDCQDCDSIIPLRFCLLLANYL